MNVLKWSPILGLCLFVQFFFSASVFADDTCIFSDTDTVKPNIVILLDSGAELEQIIWHEDYDESIDYTPDGCVEEVTSVTVAAVDGKTCFLNENGYTLVKNSGYELVKIQADLEAETKNTGIINNAAGGDSYFTIGLSSDVFLPHTPSTIVDAEGIKDNARMFRYSKNYLNWIFYHADYSGIDLPDISRFYYTKEALFAVALKTDNRAYFAIYNFVTAKGASSVQPIKLVVDDGTGTLDSAYINNINNMSTGTYSPLAEGLATVGGYFNSPSSETVKATVEYRCQDNFALVISPGVSSEDLGYAVSTLPDTLSDYDGDGLDTDADYTLTVDGITYNIPLNLNGSTYLDDVAHYMATNDMVDYHIGFQPVYTYTVGFMGSEASRRFLINTSNNGNNLTNLDYSSDPEKYHFDATTPEALATALMEAINSILQRTNTFTAPVVPVTRTTSGDRIYLSFFKPSGGNFWQGNVVKFGLNDNNEIVGEDDVLATNPNGSLVDDAKPYWATLDWADVTASNGVLYSARNIYTYLGTEVELTAASNTFNDTNITAAMLGTPTYPVDDIINYVRGADILVKDGSGDPVGNREYITGDVLHSEPLVYEYVFSGSTRTMIYFGANDGMLHAVNDTDGTEAWGFIPPHQLPRLKDMLEGSEHLYFVDATPKIYHNDLNGDGVINSIDGEQVILICGERKGSNGYFALDVTDPDAPKYLWRINQTAVDTYTPLTVIPELAESWSVPAISLVKTSDDDTTGTPVFFIGAGYDSTNSAGNAVLVINILDGSVVKKFDTGMAFSIPSAVMTADINDDGFIDKAYVGDTGGQMWRLGKFTDVDGTTPLNFPKTDQNIINWAGQIIFSAGAGRKFFYPPSVTLEYGYDLVFGGTGDREAPCDDTTSDLVFVVKDIHDISPTALTESDLIDVAFPAPPDLSVDSGWFYELATGEKVLSESTVFYKVFYFTTFTPNSDPCLPGGSAQLYAMSYKTGGIVYSEWGGLSLEIGGGIPSKPVLVISDDGEKLLVSVGSTNPDDDSDSDGAGIISFDPLFPAKNFFYLWWKQLFD